ncbi:hypothetical protein BC939DRAFT_437009 [Gamsiella multidivaricata]|uniref:uncharacterized protein n=1 Tax=Gamsiella multidivaricata TaxID=101098 RepID=UPI00222101B9|nr:uncharacterized protein BC939DRAFT_437009 [Gamsiella multidivaricata]KAI7831435.1 hypothetical protein BC939DRAFT_437009 [Gamsiella multidivaricata]
MAVPALLYSELQKLVDTLEKERKLLKEAYNTISQFPHSDTPSEKLWPALSGEILLAQIWLQSNQSMSQFHDLLLREELTCSQKVHELRQAQIRLTPTAEQQVLLIQAQKDERIRLAEISKEEKVRLAELAKEEKARLAELVKEEKVRLAELVKEEKVRLAEIAREDKVRLAEIAKDEKTHMAATEMAKEIQLEELVNKRDIRMNELQVEENKIRAETMKYELTTRTLADKKTKAQLNLKTPEVLKIESQAKNYGWEIEDFNEICNLTRPRRGGEGE